MKMQKNILRILTAALAVAGFASCNDDDKTVIVVEEANPAQVQETLATYNSLTFSWSKVQGVNQYGYTLLDADGVTVEDGVTDLRTVTFNDLLSDAKYSFELRIYGAYGEPSYHTTLQAQTLPIRQLSTPVLKAKQDGNKVVVTWDPVEGAAYYECRYAIGENNLNVAVDEPSLTIVGLAPGTHDISVEAISDYGGYTNSEVGTVQAVRTRAEKAVVTGTYTSGLIRRNNSWECTMRIYDDNSYVIEAFYQGEGYNLDFYADTDSETGETFVGIYNFASFPDCEYYVMDTGRESVPQIDMLPGEADGVYGSSLTTEGETATLTINVRYSTVEGTDKFEWKQ